MKIINFKKKKLNTYELTLSNNESVILYDDIILKYNLLITKELDTKLLNTIKEDNNKYFVYYESLKYISKKMCTETEVRKKFKEFSSTTLDYVINRLRKEKYINDDIYIKSYINDSINLKGNGPLKIKRELSNLNFNTSLIDKYLLNIDDDIWVDKINKIIEKKINSNHTDSAFILKNKIIDYLKNNGYPYELINSAISNYEFIDNPSIYEKEYNKVKNKYGKKYSGVELDYKINSYIYNKGFRK